MVDNQTFFSRTHGIYKLHNAVIDLHMDIFRIRIGIIRQCRTLATDDSRSDNMVAADMELVNMAELFSFRPVGVVVEILNILEISVYQTQISI